MKDWSHARNTKTQSKVETFLYLDDDEAVFHRLQNLAEETQSRMLVD